MRLYHKYYRQKNPGKRRASLRGERKEVHGVLMRALENPGSKRRGKNPRKPGELVDTFNLLGELNRYIDEGHTEYIPLRDTVAAKIDGYLSEDALNYSLSEALRDLSAAQVRVVRQMIADAGGEVTPEERRSIDAAAARHPTVRRAQARVVAAEKADEAFRQALKRGQLSDTEFMVGPERLAAMKEQQRGAKAELGEEIYRPEDPKLWKKVEQALEKKFPERFVPTKLKSRKRDELEQLIKMSHKDTPAAERKRIKKRLQTALTNRWRSAMILAYEKMGGREMTRAEIKLREAQRMKKLGVPFPLGPGFYGVILSPKKGKSGCVWKLLDKDGFVYMAGKSSAKNAASRDVAIAYRVLINLAKLHDDAGWDNLPTNDRRWLDDKRPELSKRVARVLMQNINERVRVTKSTAEWIVAAADVPRFEPEAEGEKDVAQTCRNMTLGEERVFPGKKGEYHIHVKKGSRGKFTYFVETREGKESAKRRTTDCNEVIRRGHLIGGAMTGAREVAKAISNPGKIRRLNNSARKYFRQQNPKMPRQAADEGDIRELTGMVGVPDNPEDAYRYGFYAGIIRGIDTCGVQNYFKRKRIRNEFQDRLLHAAMETTARVTGTRSGTVSRKRKKGTKTGSVIGDIDAELASYLDEVGD